MFARRPCCLYPPARLGVSASSLSKDDERERVGAGCLARMRRGVTHGRGSSFGFEKFSKNKSIGRQTEYVTSPLKNNVVLMYFQLTKMSYKTLGETSISKAILVIHAGAPIRILLRTTETQSSGNNKRSDEGDPSQSSIIKKAFSLLHSQRTISALDDNVPLRCIDLLCAWSLLRYKHLSRPLFSLTIGFS